MILTGPERGFTLIEVMVSLFLIGVAIAVAATVSLTIKSTYDAQSENLALRIASTELNELRAGGYAALPASGSFTSPLLSVLPSAVASTSVTSYNAKTKQVSAGVSWIDSRGATRYITLTTLITSVGGL